MIEHMEEPSMPPDITHKLRLVDAVDALRQLVLFEADNPETRDALNHAVARLATDGTNTVGGLFSALQVARVLVGLLSDANGKSPDQILDEIAASFGS